MHVLNHLSWYVGTGFPVKTGRAQISTRASLFILSVPRKRSKPDFLWTTFFSLSLLLLSSVSVVTRIRGSKFGINKWVLRKLVTHGAVHMPPLFFFLANQISAIVHSMSGDLCRRVILCYSPNNGQNLVSSRPHCL